MPWNDHPIHLGGLKIYKSTQPFTSPTAVVEVTLWQDHLDGLQALIQFTDGLERGGHGSVPGRHELIMHYRQLAAAVRMAESEAVQDAKDETERTA